MTIYVLGSNGSGQLGIGDKVDVSHATPVSLGRTLRGIPDRVQNVAAGGNHTLVLTVSGTVYAAGAIPLGPSQLDVDTSKTCHFTKVETATHPQEGERIKLCAASWDASILVTDTERLLVCGRGTKGELGLGPDRVEALSLEVIPDFLPVGTAIVDLAACMGHVVAVLSNGDVYGWGAGRQGQLGSPDEDVWRPRKIEGIPHKVVRAVCGRDFTCLFSDSSEGKLKVIGVNKRDKHSVKSDAPGKIQDWSHVQASWGTIYILLKSGHLVAWGRDDHGQLPPVHLPPLVQIAAGSEHVLGLTPTGRVLIWGWGEHGNCGLPIDNRGNVQGHWNEVDLPGNVVHIAGGCATSWIVTEDT